MNDTYLYFLYFLYIYIFCIFCLIVRTEQEDGCATKEAEQPTVSLSLSLSLCATYPREFLMAQPPPSRAAQADTLNMLTNMLNEY